MIKNFPSNRNVLWLEDIPLSIRANVNYLEQEGFEVDVVKALNEAIDIAQRTEYSIIFVDYSIPRTEASKAETNEGLGLEFISMLKRDELGKHNAIADTVLCTAQRESIGQNRQKLLDFKVDIVPKSSSYTAVVELARKHKRKSKDVMRSEDE